jgi:hypothetical protein
MKIITPVTIAVGTPGLDTVLDATNVAEESVVALWTAGTYSIGTRKYYDHIVYEVVVASTADRPDTGAALTTPSWVEVRKTNRWLMFDGSPSALTENSGTIEVEISPAERVDAVAVLKITGETLQIVMDDPTDGEVYNQTIDLQDTSNVTSWYEYCWEDFQYIEDVARIDLPGAYPEATLTITIDNGAGTAKCGELIIGRQRSIGDALFGTSVGIKNYSTIDEDAFGGFSITPRGKAKRGRFPVAIDTQQAYIVQRALTNLADIAAVYVGDPDRPETIIFGIATFDIVVEGPIISECSLDIRGYA